MYIYIYILISRWSPQFLGGIVRKMTSSAFLKSVVSLLPQETPSVKAKQSTIENLNYFVA